MRSLSLGLSVFLILFSAGFYSAYPETTSSSGVIVIGPTEKSTSQPEVVNTQASVSDPLKPGQQGDSSNVKITGPELNASFRVMYEIRGSRIGNTQVSDPVVLPADSTITSLDPGMGRAYIIVKVGEDKQETLVLNVSPEHAVGQKLPKGTYKIYPQDPDGKFMNEKLDAKVQVGLIGNQVMDQRARGELYKTEKEK